MPRRSSRLEGKGKTATNAPVESDPEHSSDPTKPVRKRAKLSADDTGSENNHHLYGEEVETSSVGEQLATSEEEDFEAPVTKRNRKRGGAKLPSTNAKTTKLVPADARFKKVRGKLGLLQKVATDMPLDVIFEVRCRLCSREGDLIHFIDFLIPRATRYSSTFTYQLRSTQSVDYSFFGTCLAHCSHQLRRPASIAT